MWSQSTRTKRDSVMTKARSLFRPRSRSSSRQRRMASHGSEPDGAKQVHPVAAKSEETKLLPTIPVSISLPDALGANGP